MAHDRSADESASRLLRATRLNEFHQGQIRADRTLATRSEIIRALVHASDEQALLNSACSILTEIGGYELAWIGFARDDEAKSVEMVAAQGRALGYAAQLRTSWANDELGRGPTGTAIRLRQLCANADTETNSQFGPWRAAAHEYWLRSSCVILLVMDDGAVGALNLYAGQAAAFTPTERQFLTQLANDQVFGISVIHEREKRRQAEEALEAMSEALALANEELLAANEELKAVNAEMTAITEELNAALSSVGESQAQLSEAIEYDERLKAANVLTAGLDRNDMDRHINVSGAEHGGGG